LWVSYTAPGLGLRAGFEIIDGEGYVDAVFVSRQGFGFEEPEDLLVAI
jgi:hypothetical protein